MKRYAINEEIELAMARQKYNEICERMRRDRFYGEQFTQIVRSLRQAERPLSRQAIRHMIRKAGNR